MYLMVWVSFNPFWFYMTLTATRHHTRAPVSQTKTNRYVCHTSLLPRNSCLSLFPMPPDYTDKKSHFTLQIIIKHTQNHT